MPVCAYEMGLENQDIGDSKQLIQLQCGLNTGKVNI